MNKVKLCPVCGLKMKELSPLLWECKCGHVEKGKPSKERKVKREMEREGKKEEVLRARFWEGKKGKITKEIALTHKKEIVAKKKRTSTRG